MENENIFQKTGYRFLVESTEIESASFPHKTACHKPILRQIEWGVKDAPITKNGVLLVTTSFF